MPFWLKGSLILCNQIRGCKLEWRAAHSATELLIVSQVVSPGACFAHLPACIMDDDWDTDMLSASCKRIAKSLRRKPGPPKGSVAKHKHAATVPAAKACETWKGAFAEVRRAAAAALAHPKLVQKKGKSFTMRWPEGFKKRLKALVERSLKTETHKAYERAAELSNFRLASHGTPIRFGSDCSGMECFIEAFKRLGSAQTQMRCAGSGCATNQ